MKLIACAVCGRAIKEGDVASFVDRGLGADAPTGWCHITCTKDGVERWVREGRPDGDPLVWDRTERPTWRHEPASARPFRDRHGDMPSRTSGRF